MNQVFIKKANLFAKLTLTLHNHQNVWHLVHNNMTQCLLHQKRRAVSYVFFLAKKWLVSSFPRGLKKNPKVKICRIKTKNYFSIAAIFYQRRLEKWINKNQDLSPLIRRIYPWKTGSKAIFSWSELDSSSISKLIQQSSKPAIASEKWRKIKFWTEC